MFTLSFTFIYESDMTLILRKCDKHPCKCDQNKRKHKLLLAHFEVTCDKSLGNNHRSFTDSRAEMAVTTTKHADF